MHSPDIPTLESDLLQVVSMNLTRPLMCLSVVRISGYLHSGSESGSAEWLLIPESDSFRWSDIREFPGSLSSIDPGEMVGMSIRISSSSESLVGGSDVYRGRSWWEDVKGVGGRTSSEEMEDAEEEAVRTRDCKIETLFCYELNQIRGGRA